jgi:hypothetical protein
MDFEAILKAASDWPVIIQGVIGSAIFWFLLELLKFITRFLSALLGKASKHYEVEILLREWIWRRFLSRNGYINIAQGYLMTFEYVFRYLITGLLFGCVAILVAGSGTLVFSIILSATIYYLLRALAWLTPRREWSGNSLSDHWKRVAQLEQQLFGELDESTQEYLEKYSTESSSKSQ